MNIKSLLIGSAAALVAVSGARAADAVVVAEPEPAEYVRICDVYGAGYFYIPGTETCLRVGGYVRVEFGAGYRRGLENVLDKENGSFNDTYASFARGRITLDARSETEMGTLRTFIAVNADRTKGRTGTTWDPILAAAVPGNQTTTTGGAYLSDALISLGGLTIGYTDSLYDTLTGSAGNVMDDGIVGYAPDRSNRISYTFDGGNGFSATLGLEDIDGDASNDSYTPNVVAGASFTQGWGAVSGVVGYDSTYGEVAGKLRVDVNVNDQLSLFVMGGLADGKQPSAYNTWGGDWAIWGGATFVANEKIAINAQLSYADGEAGIAPRTFGAVVGVDYNIVPGFVIRPEVSYAKFKNLAANTSDDGWGARIRFQRSF